MFDKIKDGSTYEVQGLKCNLPPVGYVYNRFTGQVEPRTIISRSHKKAEQKWERQELPVWWNKKEKEEKDRQVSNPEYYDPEMNKIIEREWDRRINGVWFMNNGEPVYLTGLHYMYINWWKIDVGYPKYRIVDLEYFYFLQYCIDDPESMGMFEITKRRFGKSYRGGIFLFEYVSREFNSKAGVQSKTDKDAGSLFRRAIIYPFKNLPSFFRPEWDKSSTLKKDITFLRTSTRGKNVNLDSAEEELNSSIDYRSSGIMSYDGEKVYRKLEDEVGKSTEVDVYDRHQVNYYCYLDDEGKIIGKVLQTTTVEEMESGGEAAKRLWDESDHTNKGGFKRTKTGVYRFFMPAHRTRYFNEYGIPDEERALNEIMLERKSLENSPRALSSRIRKEPLTPEEAFRIDGDRCLYDSMKLNGRLERLGWMKNYKTRGNLVWEGGIRDGKVKWETSDTGRWETCWLPKNWETDCNRIIKRGDMYLPDNDQRFTIGVDPFDHNNTEDNRRSDGAAAVYKKHDSTEPDDTYNGNFVMKYKARPQTAQIFYEDMIKTCVYFGCKLLFENQKIGLMHYFNDRGYGNFLMWIPGKTSPGISASPQSHQELAEATEDHIENKIDGVFFPDLIKDWLEFDIQKTQKYDIAMAAGYALIANKRIVNKQKSISGIDINSLFPKYKTNG